MEPVYRVRSPVLRFVSSLSSVLSGWFFRASCRLSRDWFGWNRELKDEPPSWARLAHRRRLFALLHVLTTLSSSVPVTLCDRPFGQSQVDFYQFLGREEQCTDTCFTPHKHNKNDCTATTLFKKSPQHVGTENACT